MMKNIFQKKSSFFSGGQKEQCLFLVKGHKFVDKMRAGDPSLSEQLLFYGLPFFSSSTTTKNETDQIPRKKAAKTNMTNILSTLLSYSFNSPVTDHLVELDQKRSFFL
ncbi:MAG: hypothetical protein Q8J76_11695, partial [Desulfobulbaceae bacterium]|nr:hypothetical protein [Desulfobulbaceae bacterium]